MAYEENEKPTRYSSLRSKHDYDTSSEYFTGKWRGRDVRFRRTFRGHRFSDAECEALCAGNRIEVHNLEGKNGSYAVQGMLASEDSLFGQRVVFKVIDTVPNRVNFRFGETPLYNPSDRYKPVKKVVDLDDRYEDYDNPSGYADDYDDDKDIREEIHDVKSQLAELMQKFIAVTDRSGDSVLAVPDERQAKPKFVMNRRPATRVSRRGRKYGAESRGRFVAEMMAPLGSRAHAAAAFARILMGTSGRTVIAEAEGSQIKPEPVTKGFGMSGYMNIRDGTGKLLEPEGSDEGSVDDKPVAEIPGKMPDKSPGEQEEVIEGSSFDEDII